MGRSRARTSSREGKLLTRAMDHDRQAEEFRRIKSPLNMESRLSYQNTPTSQKSTRRVVSHYGLT